MRRKVLEGIVLACALIMCLCSIFYVYYELKWIPNNIGLYVENREEGNYGRLDMGTYHMCFDKGTGNIDDLTRGGSYMVGDQQVFVDHNGDGFVEMLKYDYAIYTKDGVEHVLKKTSYTKGIYQDGYYLNDGSRPYQGDSDVIMITCSNKVDLEDGLYITYWDFLN